MDLLLIIRGLAAISVVVWHTVGYDAGLPLVNIPGRVAIWIFFGISGYVIAYGFLHKRYLLDGPGLKHFYLNRFLRIYPLFLLLSVLGWLTMWLGSGTNPLEWGDLPGQFFGLQFNHAYKLNGLFWTLGLEIQFYAIAPALAMLFLSTMFNVQCSMAMGDCCCILFGIDCVQLVGRALHGVVCRWSKHHVGASAFFCRNGRLWAGCFVQAQQRESSGIFDGGSCLPCREQLALPPATRVVLEYARHGVG